jgi:hypothetical protein
LQSSLSAWREAVALVDESWNDETAKSYRTQNLGDVELALSRMIGALQDAAEIVRGFEKKVFDPGMYE